MKTSIKVLHSQDAKAVRSSDVPPRTLHPQMASRRTGPSGPSGAHDALCTPFLLALPPPRAHVNVPDETGWVVDQRTSFLSSGAITTFPHITEIQCHTLGHTRLCCQPDLTGFWCFAECDLGEFHYPLQFIIVLRALRLGRLWRITANACKSLAQS